MHRLATVHTFKTPARGHPTEFCNKL